MKQNFAQQGIYILHGDADDNVPVEQARTMRKELGEFHPDFAYYEQPGAGHWWGDQCVDWDPMIDFFRRHERPEEKDIKRVEFTTVAPGECHWVRIEQQIKQFEASRVEIGVEPDGKTLKAKTENVSRLGLTLGTFADASPTLNIEIDGQKIENIACRGRLMARCSGSSVAAPPPSGRPSKARAPMAQRARPARGSSSARSRGRWSWSTAPRGR